MKGLVWVIWIGLFYFSVLAWGWCGWLWMVGNGWDGWGLELMGRGDWMVWVGELIGRKWGKGVKKEGILKGF